MTHVAISNAMRREDDVADEDCGADVAAEDDGARMAMARTSARYFYPCVAREGGRARASRRAPVCAVNVARARRMT